MTESKRRQLKDRGWKTGDAATFLSLSPEEAAYVELKVAFSRKLRDRRQKRKLTQSQLAKMVQSSQSRVAKMESGDPTVSLDRLVRSLLALGATKRELAKAIVA